MALSSLADQRAEYGGYSYGRPAEGGRRFIGGEFSPWDANKRRMGLFSFNRAVLPIMGAEAQARMPGGFLSDVATQRAFTAAAPGFLQAQSAENEARMAALEQAGLNPMYAQERVATDPYRGVRDLLGLRSQLENQLAERRYLSDQGIAGALSSAAMSEIQARWNKYMMMKAESQADKALGINLAGDLLGAAGTAGAGFAGG